MIRGNGSYGDMLLDATRSGGNVEVARKSINGDLDTTRMISCI